jgi:hypothetical protein
VSAGPSGAAPTVRRVPGRCPNCASRLPQPMRWRESWVAMRCPDCESCFALAASPAVLDELERRQEAGRAALWAAHERLVAERAEALAAAFARELDRGVPDAAG